MKIQYPKKRKPLKITIPTELWVYGMAVFLILSSFVGGMFFYRSGIPSRILDKVQEIAARDPVGQAVEEVSEEIQTEVQLYRANGLPNLFLDIPFESMMRIEQKREEALEIGVLHSSDLDYVPATLRLNEEQRLDMKLRLKGDWVDHLRSDKWSFRIHITEDDGAVLGMRRFSLQAPHTRSFASEWGFHQTLFREDILATRYTFVNVIINGEYKGIYALEEHFTGDLLEAQERREGIIFRLNEDLLWLDWTNFLDLENHADSKIGRFWLVDDPLANEIIPYRENYIADREALTEELNAAKELLHSFQHGFLSADQVLDEELWGKYFAITDLWAGGHGVDWINTMYYYNPVTGLLEPIAFDGFVFHPSFTRRQLAYPFSDSPLFDNPGVQKAYVETLERITTPEYIAGLKDQFGAQLEDYYDLLVKEYEGVDYEEFRRFEGPPLELPWGDLEKRAELLARNLNPAQPVRGNYHLVEREGETYLKVDLMNLMVLPVQIQELVWGDRAVAFQKAWCEDQHCAEKLVPDLEDPVLRREDGTDFTPIAFYIPLKEFEGAIFSETQLTLRVNLYGGSQVIEVPLASRYVPEGLETGIKPSVTLAEALDTHPFLVEAGENQLVIKPGTWDVEGDLILPEGARLTIPEGTTLRFGTGSVFLAHGAVSLLGTEEAPVLITAREDSWGGMVVLEASETSQWKHAAVEKMAGIPYPGWVLTGGITFYQSPVDLSHVRMGHNTTEDALNIIQAHFTMNMVEFLDTPSDAFDGDFVSGEVIACHFHDIGGDAFDVSGSSVEVRQALMERIGDKAVSVGEKSTVILEDLILRDVNIGIASKDLSSVTAEGITIERAQVAGLAAYIKKPQYGPATLTASEVELIETETLAMCQTDSRIVLNGEVIPAQDFDVGALYDQGVLGN